MKKIKTFSELNSSTYFNASDKLSNMGHHKRASNVTKYAEEVEEKEALEDWMEFINFNKSLGTVDAYVDGVKMEFCIKIELWGNGEINKIVCILVPTKLEDYKLINNGNLNYYDNLRYLTISYNEEKVESIDVFDNFNTYSTYTGSNTSSNINMDRRNALKLRAILSGLILDEYEMYVPDWVDELSENIKRYSINSFYKTTSEELYITTYNSASKKLMKNHPKRANALSDWAEEVSRISGVKRYKKTYEKFSKYGLFNIDLEYYKYSSTGSTKFIKSLNDCAFEISFTAEENYYNLQEVADSNLKNSSMYLILHILPNNYEDYEEIQDEYIDISIKYTLEVGKIEFTDIVINGVKITDRPSAGRFRNLLRKIFSKNSDYPSYGDGKLCDVIEYDFFAKLDVSSEYGVSIEDLYNLIDNIPANKLYKEK